MYAWSQDSGLRNFISTTKERGKYHYYVILGPVFFVFTIIYFVQAFSVNNEALRWFNRPQSKDYLAVTAGY